MAILLERDGTACGICGQALDPSAPTDHPAATTIDHVLPIGQGGDFGAEGRIGNLRLAHERCNGEAARNPGHPPSWYAQELRRAVSVKQSA